MAPAMQSCRLRTRTGQHCLTVAAGRHGCDYRQPQPQLHPPHLKVQCTCAYRQLQLRLQLQLQTATNAGTPTAAATATAAAAATPATTDRCSSFRCDYRQVQLRVYRQLSCSYTCDYRHLQLQTAAVQSQIHRTSPASATVLASSSAHVQAAVQATSSPRTQHVGDPGPQPEPTDAGHSEEWAAHLHRRRPVHRKTRHAAPTAPVRCGGRRDGWQLSAQTLECQWECPWGSQWRCGWG